MNNLNVIDLVNKLNNLDIQESIEDLTQYKIKIAGMLINPGATRDMYIEVDITQSVAPSPQSMLSRKGITTATMTVRADEVIVHFEADINDDIKHYLGGWIADWQRKKRDYIEENKLKELKTILYH